MIRQFQDRSIAQSLMGLVLLCLSLGALAQDSGQNPAYVIGTGDRLSIEVFNETDLTGAYLVDEDGTIRVPFIGRVRAAGITLSALQEAIHQGLEGDYLINPRVSVSMDAYRQFFISGEVESPGGYAYEANMTVQKAITLAGGMTEYGTARKIYLQKEGQTEDQQVKVDIDTLISPGDIITVKQSFF